MTRMVLRYFIIVILTVCFFGALLPGTEETQPKPSPEEVWRMLSEGNLRFAQGQVLKPHQDKDRLALANAESQAKYAYATIVSCSDSRVPVELIFDAGLMDLFVVRIAGNVCDTDEIGSVEYGLAHVKTPLLLILGHSQCGAVTAVTQELQGLGHPLERNIPPLVDNIIPAVQRAIKLHPEAQGDKVVPFAIEENVWQSISDIFVRSAAVRQMVKEGQVKVMGAVYDLSRGRVSWLSRDKVEVLLKEAEANPKRATNPMAEGPQEVHH